LLDVSLALWVAPAVAGHSCTLCLSGGLAAGARRGSAARAAYVVAANRATFGRRLLIRIYSWDVDLAHEGGSVTGYVGRALETPVSPCGLVRAGLDADPDGLALISADTRWTWRTLDDLSDRLAVSLLGLGLNWGDRVASLMPNRPALVVH
jgi:hypothetical protein